jgi:uncharacterized damage-inducible protein DinB
MLTELITTLYQYNAWANGRILDRAGRLIPDQLVASGGASFDSVRDTLVHTMSGQWIWLARWQGVSPSAMLDPAKYADIPALRSHWAEIEQDTQTFIAALDEPQLAEIIRYTNTKGQPYAYPLWQQMVHQVNHATQHRSEVAMMLTGFGHSPGWLDLLVYVDKKNL